MLPSDAEIAALCGAIYQPTAMVDFDHVAVATPWTRENNYAGRCRCNSGAPRTTKIKARMKGDLMRERIDARTEFAGQFKASAMDRCG